MTTYNILSIEEFKTIIEKKSRLLGIDTGEKNVGFAICDENKKVATPLKIIRRNKSFDLMKFIHEIINENHIKGIIVGDPINMDGSLGNSSEKAKKFALNLSKNITIPIAMWDERLSTEGTFKITKKLGTNVTNRVKKLDKNAAAFILQGAIDFLTN
tara:strand:- start:316 stop:786 length:471 start_codon:yes stop_codon:yes gene_type:complete